MISPECRARGSTAITNPCQYTFLVGNHISVRASNLELHISLILMAYVPPSSCWRSGTRLGRLNASNVSVCSCCPVVSLSGGETRGAVGRGQQTVQRDDFTHVGCAGSEEWVSGWAWCRVEGGGCWARLLITECGVDGVDVSLVGSFV